MTRIATLGFLLVTTSVAAQTNGRFEFRIDGPCGETIVGPPGSQYDDGTGGLPYYTEWREFPDGVTRLIARQWLGHTWEVVFTTEDLPDTGNLPDYINGVQWWQYALGAEGPLEIVDMTTDGTAGCSSGRFPECLRLVGYDYTELVDPSEGDQIDENVAAYSYVLLTFSGIRTLPLEGSVAVGKVRLFGRFPEEEGMTASGRVYFTTWVAPTGYHVVAATVSRGRTYTEEIGDPPVTVIDCEYTLKASSVAPFIRCDSNGDGAIDVADAVHTLNELYLGHPHSSCSAAADCNGDGTRDLSDAVFGLSHIFVGTAPPPRPYPSCGRVDVPVEECPPGSTDCG